MLVLSEILLQRTRAETVGRFIDGFVSKHGSWSDLAGSSLEELENDLKPLGLWRRRAESLYGFACSLADLGYLFPSHRADIEKLPAVGQYVANAIELFYHGKPRPLLDVNMARVLERYFRPRLLSDIRYDPWLQEISSKLVENGDPVKINWAVLDVAAIHCKKDVPKCAGCPLSLGCAYHP